MMPRSWFSRSLALAGLVLVGWPQASIGADGPPVVYVANPFWKREDDPSRFFRGKYRFELLPLGRSSPEWIGGEKMPVLRDEAGKPISAGVWAAYVVDEKGRVADCAILDSKSELASRAAVEWLGKQRYMPAMYKGEMVMTGDSKFIEFKAPQKRGFFPLRTYRYPLDWSFGARWPEEKMQAYIEKLNEVCRKYFDRADVPERFYIVVVILPQEGARVWFMSSRRDAEDPERLDLRRQLEAVSAPDVTGGPLAFAIQADISDGDRLELTAIDHGYELPIPKKWARFSGRDRRFSDAYFKKLWYLEDR